MIKVLGVPLKFHPLFVMVALASILTGFFLEIIILFAVVFIHELGHAAAAKSFGWRVREVKLLPFGGVAEVDEHMNIHPLQTLAVAAAGPLQHVWMILISYFFMSWGIWDAQWGNYFIKVNTFIGLFNLIPVPPLDGGKMLLALLSLKLPYYRSLIIAAWIGFVGSIALMTYCAGLMLEGAFPLNLLVISIFLFWSNLYLWRNIPYHFMRFLMHRQNLHAAAKSKRDQGPIVPLIISGKETLHRAVQMLKQQQRYLIYVVGSSGDIQDVIPEEKLIAAYFSKLRQRF